MDNTARNIVDEDFGKKVYTIKDIENLPEGERAELIDGKLYMMATPSFLHQDISSYLTRKIGNYIEEKGGKCKVVAAPLAVYLFADDSTYLEPDVLVVCDEEKITKKGINGAPDFVIEIVSPSSIKLDYMLKTELYRKAGVRLYWVVDPERLSVTTFDIEHDVLTERTFDDKIHVDIYDDLEIDFTPYAPVKEAAE